MHLHSGDVLLLSPLATARFDAVLWRGFPLSKQPANVTSGSMETPVAEKRAGKRLLTPDDVASIFSVDRRTVLKWARDGKLERAKVTGKVVRFTEESVNSFVKSKTPGVECATAPNPKQRARVAKSGLKKGYLGSTSRKSWRSLREEVTTWQ